MNERLSPDRAVAGLETATSYEVPTSESADRFLSATTRIVTA
jgi:hypothetical protein